MENSPLYFTKVERLGILLFAIILILLLILPSWWPGHSTVSATDFSLLEQQIHEWSKSKQTVFAVSEQKNELSQQLAPPSPFDPNTASREQLLAAGLPATTIRSWLSYTRKGGQFNKWEDVMKFRALSPADREKLRPLLVFPSKTEAKSVVQVDEIEAYITPLAFFDPHKVTVDQLEEWGINERAARNWVKFIGTGARFLRAEDIAKIYAITPEEVQRLLPYVQITAPETAANVIKPATSRPSRFDGVIDINTATAEEWQQLHGIGPAYSRRIVNFREKLGGFHAVEQVAQTYGLPDSVFLSIQPQLALSPHIRPLAINQSSVEELAAHPYLRFQEARMIIKYREEHGPFANFSALAKIYGLQDETRRKIAPYLSFH